MKPLVCNSSIAAPELLCRMAVVAPETPDNEVMFMPAGTHVISPTQGGRAVTAQVLVTREAAGEMERQRAALVARGKRPYFDFNHEDRDASFWPTQFFWKDGDAPGVYARGEWSDVGKQSISGKRYRQFSPVFYVNDVRATPARIVCREDAKPNFGGLVNDPAFHQILPFWAKHAGDGEHQNQNQTVNMTPQEIAALQAKIAALESDVNAFKGKETEAAALAAKQAELKLAKAELAADEAEKKAKALEAKNTALEAADLKRRQDSAKQYAADMVARGALAAKDAEAIADVEKNMTEKPEVFGPIYAKWASEPALQQHGLTRSTTTQALAAKASTSIVMGAMSASDAVKAYAELMAKQRIEGVTLGQKAEISREGSAIYARELRNNAGLLDMPLMGANSVGTVAGTLVTQRTLEFLHLVLPVLSMISTDFSDQQAKFNQQVISRILSAPTVGTYDPAAGYAQTDQTATDVPVTIDQHKYVMTSFDANTLGSTVRRLFDEFAMPNAYAMALEMATAVLGLITNANFPNFTLQNIDDFSRGDVIDMGTALTKRGVPQGSANRSLLLFSDFYAKLAKDSGTVLNAVTALAAFKNPEIITEGVMPDLHGFKVADTPSLPDNGEHLVGAGFSKSALVLSTRLPIDYTQILPGASFGNVTVVTNPDSGFSVMQAEYVDHKLGSANQRSAWMYGKAKGQANALQRLKNA